MEKMGKVVKAFVCLLVVQLALFGATSAKADRNSMTFKGIWFLIERDVLTPHREGMDPQDFERWKTDIEERCGDFYDANEAAISKNWQYIATQPKDLSDEALKESFELFSKSFQLIDDVNKTTERHLSKYPVLLKAHQSKYGRGGEKDLEASLSRTLNRLHTVGRRRNIHLPVPRRANSGLNQEREQRSRAILEEIRKKRELERAQKPSEDPNQPVTQAEPVPKPATPKQPSSQPHKKQNIDPIDEWFGVCEVDDAQQQSTRSILRQVKQEITQRTSRGRTLSEEHKKRLNEEVTRRLWSLLRTRQRKLDGCETNTKKHDYVAYLIESQ